MTTLEKITALATQVVRSVLDVYGLDNTHILDKVQIYVERDIRMRMYIIVVCLPHIANMVRQFDIEDDRIEDSDLRVQSTLLYGSLSSDVQDWLRDPVAFTRKLSGAKEAVTVKKSEGRVVTTLRMIRE